MNQTNTRVRGMGISQIQRLSGIVLTCMVLSACVSAPAEPPYLALVAGDGAGDPARIGAEITELPMLPKSRYGNPPSYAVLGQTYRVSSSAEGFTQTGLASWYGSKFHGRRTSSGEVYDMYQMTAAHKHLPLPTFVRVTRTDTGQSVIVKVNDRGPFVGERIIDLSFAAATRLDMLDSGTAPVHIEALTDPAVISSAQQESAGDLFVQVGSFTERANAQVMQQQLLDKTRLPVRVQVAPSDSSASYRVLVGPFETPDAQSEGMQQLTQAGFIDHFAVVGVK